MVGWGAFMSFSVRSFTLAGDDDGMRNGSAWAAWG